MKSGGDRVGRKEGKEDKNNQFSREIACYRGPRILKMLESNTNMIQGKENECPPVKSQIGTNASPVIDVRASNR